MSESVASSPDASEVPYQLHPMANRLIDDLSADAQGKLKLEPEVADAFCTEVAELDSVSEKRKVGRDCLRVSEALRNQKMLAAAEQVLELAKSISALIGHAEKTLHKVHESKRQAAEKNSLQLTGRQDSKRAPKNDDPVPEDTIRADVFRPFIRC
jgi:hypothetical protein